MSRHAGNISSFTKGLQRGNKKNQPLAHWKYISLALMPQWCAFQKVWGMTKFWGPWSAYIFWQINLPVSWSLQELNQLLCGATAKMNTLSFDNLYPFFMKGRLELCTADKYVQTFWFFLCGYATCAALVNCFWWASEGTWKLGLSGWTRPQSSHS